MRRRWLPAMICVLVFGGVWAQGGDANKDKEKLQGKWVAEKDGKKVELTFAGDNFTVVFDGDKKVEGKFKIDAGKKPKHIDMAVTKGDDGRFDGKTSLGLYELDGDMLKWCANEPGREGRPPEFTEKGEQGRYMLLTLTKTK